MKLTKHLAPAFFALFGIPALLLAIACSGDGDPTPTPDPIATIDGTGDAVPACAPDGAAALTGAGATFPFPLYSKWVDAYNSLCDVRVNYQSIGSGAGIKNIIEQTIDFGASDGIMSSEQEARAEAAGGDILHIAMVAGAEAVVYNLPGIERGELKLDGPALAAIYLGEIRRWNDPALVELNPGLNLPDTEIAVVYRSDGSGTTFIFTNYLSRVSPEWKDGPGFATAVEWPTGVGGQGNEGVAGQVAQIPGAIGYVELAYATHNDMTWAQLKNRAGRFTEPSLDGAKAASDISIPADMKVLITDSENPDAYPIAGFTWVLAYVDQTNAARGRALAHYLWWAVHDGQAYTQALDYAPLSDEAVKAAEAQIQRLQCGGASCLSAQFDRLPLQ